MLEVFFLTVCMIKIVKKLKKTSYKYVYKKLSRLTFKYYLELINFLFEEEGCCCETLT